MQHMAPYDYGQLIFLLAGRHGPADALHLRAANLHVRDSRLPSCSSAPSYWYLRCSPTQCRSMTFTGWLWRSAF